MIVSGMIVSNLVRTILMMTLSGSALALILLLTKPLLGRRVPRSVQYGLWLVALAALLVPVSKFIILPDKAATLPLTPISVVIDQSFISPAENLLRTIHVPDAAGAVDAADPTSAESASGSSVPASTAATTPTPAETAAATPTSAETAAEAADAAMDAEGSPSSAALLPAKGPGPLAWLSAGFIIVYLPVALLVLLYHLLSYAYFMGKLCNRRTTPALDLAVYTALYDGKPAPRVFLCPLAATPMLVGLFRPMIILPDRPYSEAQLRSVLLHELTHMRRRDVAVKWVTVFACSLHWFNPLVWLARREINRVCELSCDAAVIGNMNSVDKQTYLQSLVALAADPRAPRAVLATTLCEGKKALEERLVSIMRYKPHRLKTLVASALMIVAAVGVVSLLGASVAAAENAAQVATTGTESPDISSMPHDMDDPNYDKDLYYDWDPLNEIESQTASDDSSLRGIGGNLIPNGDFEAFLPIGNLSRNVALNGTNTFTLITDPAIVKYGKAALMIEQNTRNAFAGCRVLLERDCVYDFEFDVRLLHDSNGNPVSNLEVVRNFVFADAYASNYNQNHIATLKKMSTADGWQHVAGSYKASSADPRADFDNAYFAIYVHGPEDRSVTYVIDNVRLVKQGQIQNLVPNGDFELPVLFGNLGGNSTLNGSNTITLETDPSIVKYGNAALRIEQKTRNAFAGCRVSLERNCLYDFEFDIRLLLDSEGNPVSNLDVVRNFVFADKSASNFDQNHLATVKKLSTADGWQHISGSWRSSSADPNADFANAYFSVYISVPSAGNPVTYVIDNVKLTKR
ncbi:MAG: M56 family metallopeptidase [Peptococcaceae bacterium]|nr:M56 family metallopeptidase [Peptococcaceae bacterium]